MTSKLFLDDVRDAPDSSWDVVRDYNSFVRYIEENGCPSVISFDHDLGLEHYPQGAQDPNQVIDYDKFQEKTGYHCAQWLVEQKLCPKEIIVHSFNFAGARNIYNLLKQHFGSRCSVIIKPRFQ